MKLSRRKKTTLVAVLVSAMLFSTSGGMAGTVSQAKSEVKLSKKSLKITKGKTKKLSVKNASQKVKWSVVSGKKVVKLTKKGKYYVKIKGLKAGSAKVQAAVKVSGKKMKKLVCKIKVTAKSAASVPTVSPSMTEGPAADATAEPSRAPEKIPVLNIKDGVLLGGTYKNVYTLRIPAGVTEIADDAVSFAKSVEHVELPEGLTKIGEKAFNECTQLKSISCPDSLLSIGKDAFFECTSLEHVHLNDGLISIGVGSFFQCSALEEITIPSSVTGIGKYAFGWCESLKSAEIDARIDAVPPELFTECTGLEQLTISEKTKESIKTVGSRAFYNTGITGFPFSASLEEVGADAFQGCVIKKLTINAKKIGDSAFANCGLTDLTLGENVQEIGAEAFCGYGWEEETERKNVMKIPASVTSIAKGAFEGYRVLGYEVDEDNRFFEDVDGVLFTEDKKTLLKYPSDKRGADYKVPAGTRVIGERAFCEAGKLNGTLYLPDGLEEIEKSAFLYNRIRNISFPDSLKKIGEEAFSGSENIKRIVLTSGLEAVGESAFQGCDSLRRVTIEKGIKELDAGVFAGCVKLKSVEIPDSVASIDPTCFMQNPMLESYEWITFTGNSNFYVDDDGVLFSKDRKTLIAYPVMTDRYSEADSYQENKYTIPDGVTEIADRAFFDAPVERLEIPASVTKVGEDGFGFIGDYSDGAMYLEGFCAVSESEAAWEYAEKNQINIVEKRDESFYDEMGEIIPKEISLKAGETFDLKVEGTGKNQIFYTSSEPEIATVDDQGRITAVAKGSTCVIASVEAMYFPCNVEVTTGEEPEVDTKYYKFVNDDDTDVEAWEKEYFTSMGGTVTKTDFPASNTYSSNLYKCINSTYLLETYPSAYQSYVTDVYGEGNGEYYITIGTNLDRELACHEKSSKNLLLFSGTSGVSYLTGKTSSLADMKSIVGTTIYDNSTISTSLYQRVALNFSGGAARSVILEIETDKDYTPGLFIRSISEYEGEMELLLHRNISFEVKDAGVRRYFRADYDMETEETIIQPVYAKYLRLHVVRG